MSGTTWRAKLRLDLERLEFTKIHREIVKIAQHDKVCQRLMTTPGVGALVAITYRSAIDVPHHQNHVTRIMLLSVVDT